MAIVALSITCVWLSGSHAKASGGRETTLSCAAEEVDGAEDACLGFAAEEVACAGAAAAVFVVVVLGFEAAAAAGLGFDAAGFEAAAAAAAGAGAAGAFFSASASFAAAEAASFLPDEAASAATTSEAPVFPALLAAKLRALIELRNADTNAVLLVEAGSAKLSVTLTTRPTASGNGSEPFLAARPRTGTAGLLWLTASCLIESPGMTSETFTGGGCVRRCFLGVGWGWGKRLRLSEKAEV